MSLHKRNTKRLVVGDTVIETKHFTDHCISKDHPDFQKVAKLSAIAVLAKSWSLSKKMLAATRLTTQWFFGTSTTARVCTM